MKIWTWLRTCKGYFGSGSDISTIFQDEDNHNSATRQNARKPINNDCVERQNRDLQSCVRWKVISWCNHQPIYKIFQLVWTSVSSFRHQPPTNRMKSLWANCVNKWHHPQKHWLKLISSVSDLVNPAVFATMSELYILA